MAYMNPLMVLSPKGRIADLDVLHDSGESGFSVAQMTWDGVPGSVGVRWNGSEAEGVGNPQSRGIPTWFILPEPLAIQAIAWAKKQAAPVTEKRER